MKSKNSLTLTIVANMTSNYSENLGNIASVQKIFKNRKVYTIRSRESLKNAIMIQSAMYDDLKTEVNDDKKKKVNQKVVNKELNASNCRALEGGYMNTTGTTNIRKSSFYLTDAISCESFINETRFHNNLFQANNFAKSKNIEAKEAGLMPYQYEYDKSLKVYSITIDLDMIGKDENFEQEEGYKEADNKEKAGRVKSILDAVENLSLIVKGNLDNAEPIFIVGGLSDRKTHYFENVVKLEENKIIISEDLKNKIQKGYYVGLLEGKILENEVEIKEKLNPISIAKFFDNVREEIDTYFNV